MNILIKAAIIVDESTKHHLKKRDVLIEKGVITKIAKTIANSKQIKRNQITQPAYFSRLVRHECFSR